MPDLGELWYKKFYDRIASSMGFEEEEDALSRDVLSQLLSLKTSIPRSPAGTSTGSTAVVLMSGRNLDQEIDDVIVGGEKKQFIIAADGSAGPLLNATDLYPDVIVTDLDSCPFPILERVSNNGLLFVHSHGDNIQYILSKVPILGPSLFGTTQVASTRNVQNIGGFMDGDRACYAAAFLGFQNVIILGLDFEVLLEKTRTTSRYKRMRKLSWSRASLEFLVSNSKARFSCPDSSQVTIAGLEKLSPLELRRVSS